MRYGITMFATDVSIDIVELAREAEARGFESLWLPGAHPHPGQPPHAAAHRRRRAGRGVQAVARPARGAGGGGRRPPPRLRLGTGILLAAQREPIVTAKAVATLDHLSGGRVALGVGFGWNEDELEHHGVAMADRRAVAREHVLAMQALWADDEAEFDGEHVRFSPSWSWPKPVQRGADGRPRVPVLLGGAPGPEAVRPHRRVRRRLDPDRRGRAHRRHPAAAARSWRRRAATRRARDRAVRLDPRPGQARPLRADRRHRVRVPPARARRATSCCRSSTSRPPSSPAAA